jgi:hypothetical protein
MIQRRMAADDTVVRWRQRCGWGNFARCVPMLRREKLWVQHLDTIGARGWAIDQARKLGAAFLRAGEPLLSGNGP